MSPRAEIKGPDRGFDRFDRQAEEIVTGISEPPTRADRVALAGVAEALADADRNQSTPDFGKFADRVREEDR